MGEGVGVDPVDRGHGGMGADLGFDQHGVVEERGGGDTLGELGRELPEGGVQRTLLDEAGDEAVPEGVGAAVAEHDLVAVGQLEQLGQAVAKGADHEAYGTLPVRGAHHLGRGVHHGLDLLGPHLRRTGAEPAVGGLDVGWDRDLGGVRHHRRATIAEYPHQERNCCLPPLASRLSSAPSPPRPRWR